MSGEGRSNPFCRLANRGGRKHTGKKRKLEIAKGVVNILQCNVTAWSEHARHYILTSDFDAALISETHLGRDKLVTAVTEARKSSWAGTDSAAISTANNGTSAGVLAWVRTHWFSKPVSDVQPKLEFSAPTQDWRSASFGSWAGRLCCSQRTFRALCRFPQRCQGQFDARRVFSHERWEMFIYLGSGLQFRTQLVAGLVYSWRQPLDPKVGSIGGHARGFHTHTCRTGRGQKPNIIDYFLVSTLIRPPMQKCEVVKSVPWAHTTE